MICKSELEEFLNQLFCLGTEPDVWRWENNTDWGFSDQNAEKNIRN